jgi:hypothetical protein
VESAAIKREKTTRLPHERDEASDGTHSRPREMMQKAKRDLDAGLVDTDLRTTPGLDADRRRRIVKENTDR